jgi:hypothetical protein
LAAAVGLAAATVEEVRRLPSALASLPAGTARSLALAGRTARRRYDELALHGRDVLAGRVTAAPDRVAALADSAAARTAGAAGRLADVVSGRSAAAAGVADDAADVVAGAAMSTASIADRVADRLDGIDPTGDELAARAADAELSRDAGTGGFTVSERPPIGRTEPVELSEDALEEVAQLRSGAELTAAELPLADFDHQTVPQLRGRLRTLTVPELVQLRDYESAHASRAPVLTLLDNRIARLSEPAPGQ